MNFLSHAFQMFFHTLMQLTGKEWRQVLEVGPSLVSLFPFIFMTWELTNNQESVDSDIIFI